MRVSLRSSVPAAPAAVASLAVAARGLGNENIDYTAGSFEPKNGRVVASLTAGPPSAGGAFSCPPGQRLVLASVSYTGIVLTDTTNGVSTAVADASRGFLAL